MPQVAKKSQPSWADRVMKILSGLRQEPAPDLRARAEDDELEPGSDEPVDVNTSEVGATIGGGGLDMNEDAEILADIARRRKRKME